MIRFYDVENTAHIAQATLKRSTGVNGSKTITGEIIAGNAVINGIGRGWSLVFEDEPYIITYTKFNDQTNSVEFDAIQKFFWYFAKSGFYQEWNGSHTFTDYLDALFKNTGYEYILEANVAAFEKENWGMKNRLALFNDVISQAGVEFELIGKRVKITKSIGSDLSTIVRKGFNLSDMVKESSITDFVTCGKGFGAFNDSNDQSKGRLEVEYRSPLADIYGVLEADPLVDERYTIADSLLAAVKAEVDNSVAISIDLKIYDLPDTDFTYQVPQAGDWIMAIDEAIGFSRRIRIINVDEEFDVNGKRIDYTATCGDLPVAVQQELAQSGQAHKIEQLTKDVDAAAISANGKNTNYYGSAEPSQPREGDLWYKKNGDDTELYVWANGRWEIVVSKNTGNIIDQKVDSKLAQLNADMSTANSNLQAAQQDVADLQVKLKDNDDIQAQLKNDLSENSTILEKAQADIVTNANELTELDAKLKDNDDAQAQLKNDLAANTKVQTQLKKDLSDNTELMNQVKTDTTNSLEKVNENLTQAQSDAAQAVKHVDQAVANAKLSADASGLSADSAQAASEAANAAKQLATEVSNNFAPVKSQASKAAIDAATALDQAKSALSTANSVQTGMQPAIATAVDKAKGELSLTIKTVQSGLDGLSVGGTNLLVQGKRATGYIGDTGAIVASTTVTVSDYIAIDPKNTYQFQLWIDTDSNTNSGFAFFDSSKKFISKRQSPSKTATYLSAALGASQMYPIPATAKYIRISALKGAKVKFERGTIATDWSPAPEDVKSQITTNSTQITANSKLIAASATQESVNTLTQKVTTNTAQIKLTATEADLKLATNAVDALTGRVTTAEGKITATSEALKAVYTKSETTNLLGGYATQTWAQNKITATATGLETQLSSVTQRLNLDDRPNLISGSLQNLNNWVKNLVAETAVENIVYANASNTMIYKGARNIEIISAKLPTSAGNNYIASIDFTGPNFNTITGYGWGPGVHFGTDQDHFATLEPGANEKRYIFRFVASGNDTLYLRFGNVADGASNTFVFANISIQLDTVSQVTATEMSTVKQDLDEWSAKVTNTQGEVGALATKLRVTSDGIQSLTDKQDKQSETISSLKSGADGFNSTIQQLQFNQAMPWASTLISDNMTNWTLNDVMQSAAKISYANGVNTFAYKGVGGVETMSTMLPTKEGNKYVLTFVATSPQYTPLPLTSAAPYNGIGLSVAGSSITLSPGDNGKRYTLRFVAKGNDVLTFNNGAVPDGVPMTFKISSLSLMLDGISMATATEMSSINQTVKGIQLTVADKASQSQITQLQDLIDLRVKVDGKIAAALSLSADGGGTVTIRGASLYVTAASHFDNASIKSAYIDSLDATKITSGSISSDRLATTKLNADNITSGSISADRIATTKLNADNITSGKINASLITTGDLNADRIHGGTFDASTMTVKNINAGSITSGSIATERLATTKLNADNITSGSIAAERLAATKISATNIVGGTFDAGTMTVKRLSADMIATGTLDVSKLTAVKNFSASNIIGGTLDASTMTVKKLSASSITGGTIDGTNVNVIGLNASAITTGTIKGANLAINLNTGQVVFQSGRIHSADNTIDIDVDSNYISTADDTTRVILKGGEMQFVEPNTFSTENSPYLRIYNGLSGGAWNTAAVVGRDCLTISNSANLGDSLMPYYIGKNTFSGLRTGKTETSGLGPTYVGGAERGVSIVGGSVTTTFDAANSSPYIRVGSSLNGQGVGNRIYMFAEYIHAKTIYKHTGSGSANVIVNDDGALVRTSSATKYKSNIERFRNTDMGEALLNLPQAHWYNKQDMQRYADDPQHYSMPELDYGMIAEDLAAAGLEDLVVRGDDGELEDIRYDRIGPALLPLLAQMKQEIEELKGEK